MIAINEKIVETLFKQKELDVDALITSKKNEVENFMVTPTRIVDRQPKALPLSSEEVAYLKLLTGEFEKIAFSDNSNLEKYKERFNKIIDSEAIKSNTHKLFRNELIKRMGYSDLRDDFYPKYFEQMGIRACVYCNSQFALTVEKLDGTKSAKFQVDHYYPKSKYPCFSISFYNLYPVCGSCNNSKSSDDTVNFQLYSGNFKDFTKCQFYFEIEKESLVKYRVNGTQDALKIKFHEPATSGFNEAFAVEGIYNQQKDVAEEIVLKSIIYNKAYINQLRASLGKLYSHKGPMLSRLVVGNYVDVRDIHKRPMAKFTQDIARQVGLI